MHALIMRYRYVALGFFVQRSHSGSPYIVVLIQNAVTMLGEGGTDSHLLTAVLGQFVKCSLEIIEYDCVCEALEHERKFPEWVKAAYIQDGGYS